jgi:hypothetical protein
MPKEDKYHLAKSLMEGGNIKTVRDLLAVLHKTVLSKDIKVTPVRFNKLIDNPQLFMFQDALAIAEVIGVDPKKIIDIITTEVLTRKRKRK